MAAAKSLVLYIDQNLNWEFDISEISKKIAPGISSIKRIRDFVPREILLTIHKSSLISIIVVKLQKLQNRAAHITTFSNYDSNTDQLLRGLNWNKLIHQSDGKKAIMTYKAVNNQISGYLGSRFTPRLDVLNYNLRNVQYTLSLQEQILEEGGGVCTQKIAQYPSHLGEFHVKAGYV